MLKIVLINSVSEADIEPHEGFHFRGFPTGEMNARYVL